MQRQVNFSRIYVLDNSNWGAIVPQKFSQVYFLTQPWCARWEEQKNGILNEQCNNTECNMLFLLSLFTALKYSENKILNEQCSNAAELFLKPLTKKWKYIFNQQFRSRSQIFKDIENFVCSREWKISFHVCRWTYWTALRTWATGWLQAGHSLEVKESLTGFKLHVTMWTSESIIIVMF